MFQQQKGDFNMMNQTILIGRVTHDIKLEETTSGIAYCKNALAVARKHGNAQTDFINIIVWRNNAVFFSKYVQKGALIAIRGRLESNTYTDRNGTKMNYVQVNVDQVEMVGVSKTNNTQEFKLKESQPDEVKFDKETKDENEVPWELDL